MLRTPFRLRWALLGVAAVGLIVLTPTASGGSGVGGVFNLGKVNDVNVPTALLGTTPNSLGQLYVHNLGTGGAFPAIRGESSSASGAALVGRNNGGGPALGLLVSGGVPPLTVNSIAKVTNLNADLFDGHDSAFFLPKSGTAANSALLGGHAPSFFLPAGGTAANSTLLQGHGPGDFLAANGTAADSNELGGNMPAFYQQRVTGTCGANKAIDAVNSDGTVTCQDAGTGTVTEVDAGVGLTGGPITSSGTLSLKPNYQLPQSCIAAEVPVSDGSGGWTCGSGGSSGWSLTGNSGTTPGTDFLGTTDNTALQLQVNSQRALQLEPDATSPNLIGGFSGNSVKDGAHGVAISGGGYDEGALADVNTARDNFDVISGGYGNRAGSNDSDPTTAEGASVGGGISNTASGTNAPVVAGGHGNTASGNSAAVSGGVGNVASGTHASISGGTSNIAGGVAAAIPGGSGNTANGANSFAAGNQAQANSDGTFVWGDNSANQITAPAANTFVARSANGFWFGTNSAPVNPEGQAPAQLISTSTGAYLGNNGQWVNASDRARKHDWRALNKQNVLHRLAHVPIGSWSYKVEPRSIRHVGPMAQDFFSAFRLGGDRKTIGTVDEGGIALAAIQGLYHQNRALQRQNRTLSTRLTKLERAVRHLQKKH